MPHKTPAIAAETGKTRKTRKNVPGRATSLRRQRLLAQIGRSEEIRVTELAEAFQVSELTIRRDLDQMEQEGLIDRFHGGARLPSTMRPEILFDDKPLLRAHEKEAIGRAAAELINDGETVLVNGGTTTLAVLRHLRSKSICVVTNNAAAPLEMGESRIELILLGGQYRAKSRSLFGELAALTLSQVNGGVCILGTNGISSRTGTTTSVYSEGAINRLMSERCAGKVIVVADGTKIGAVSSFSSVPLKRVDILITDSSADPDELAAIRAAGVEVIVCPISNSNAYAG